MSQSVCAPDAAAVDYVTITLRFGDLDVGNRLRSTSCLSYIALCVYKGVGGIIGCLSFMLTV